MLRGGVPRIHELVSGFRDSNTKSWMTGTSPTTTEASIASHGGDVRAPPKTP